MTVTGARIKGYSVNNVVCTGITGGIDITVRQRTDDNGGEVAPQR